MNRRPQIKARLVRHRTDGARSGGHAAGEKGRSCGAPDSSRRNWVLTPLGGGGAPGGGAGRGGGGGGRRVVPRGGEGGVGVAAVAVAAAVVGDAEARRLAGLRIR